MNPRLPRRGPRSTHPDQVARPTLVPVRRRSLKAFLLEEWSLLLLAAALSIIVWIVVGEQVIQRHEIRNVEVELVVDPAIAGRIDAVFSGPPRTTVTLNCSQREYDEAVRSLDRNGRSVVTLRVHTGPEKDARPLNLDYDHYVWEFDHNRILVRAGLPAGMVFKLEPQILDLAEPETIPNKAELKAKKLHVDIDFLVTNPSRTAPGGFLKDPIRPDPLDLRALVEDGNTEPRRTTETPLVFSKWRAGGAGAEQAWREKLDLSDVVARVTVTQVGVESLTNRLYFQGDPTKHEFGFKDQQEMISNGVSVIVGDGLRFKGLLRGPGAVLKQLADPKEAHRWAWGIVIIDPENLPTPEDKDESGQPKWMSLRAVIEWLPFRDAFRDQGVTFEVPKRLDPDFEIKVRLRPESK